MNLWRVCARLLAALVSERFLEIPAGMYMMCGLDFVQASG